MGRKPKVAMMEPIFDRTDLASLFESGKPEAQHEPDNEIKLFQNALDFADLRVRDCMVPRIDMEAVDIDDTSIKALTARLSRVSIPVFSSGKRVSIISSAMSIRSRCSGIRRRSMRC